MSFLLANPYWLLLFIGVALVIGSFLNVCIGRWPLEQSVVFPGSHCPACKKPVAWFDNIPLVSYLLLRARCRTCGIKIPRRYFVVEFITPLLFLLAVWRHEDFITWPFTLYLMSSLIIATFVDLEHWIIPDLITLPGIVIGFISSFFVPYLDPLSSLAGILVGGGILFLIGYVYLRWKKVDGIGGGDIKFLAMAGAFLGFKAVLVALVLASTLGALVGIFLVWRGGKTAKAAVQFGPFLALGVFVAFLWGDQIAHWYLGIPLPLAP